MIKLLFLTVLLSAVLIPKLILAQFGTFNELTPEIYNSFTAARSEKSFIDSLEQRQGHWEIKRYYSCENGLKKDSSVVAEGNYLNGEKSGLWFYYSSDLQLCYKGEQLISRTIYKTEEYLSDTIYINLFDKYNIITTRDTSFLFARMYVDYPLICAECTKKSENKITTCKIFGGNSMNFIRDTLYLEKAKDVFDLVESGCLSVY